MKKVLALALALIMMFAIAIPAMAAAETQVVSKVDDEVAALGTGTDIKYGVTQAYTVTIPADVTFVEGVDHEDGDEMTAERTISASDVVIAGNEWLVVTVASSHQATVNEKTTWQMHESNSVSTPVSYTATARDNDATAAADDRVLLLDGSKVLVVAPVTGNVDTAGNTGSTVIDFATKGTGQEGQYLDQLTFSCEITTTNPIQAAQG